MPRKLLIAGGSGLIGTEVSRQARESDWEVTLLSRHAGPGKIKWEPAEGVIEIPTKIKFDAIFNLAGESISEGRWTDDKKREIYNSRIKSTRTLENYLFDGRISTDFYLGASAVGIYGDKGDNVVTEDTPVAKDWFAKTVIDWEKEHHRIAQLDIRTVIIRTGIVLSTDGGALKELMKTMPFGFLSYFGTGRQFWPWIHIQDHARMLLYCADKENLSGVFLGVSPNPVSVKNLIQSINTHLKTRKVILSVPRFALALVLGEMHRVLFDSCKAIPEKIKNGGFQFSFPDIDKAAKDLLDKRQ